MGFNIPNFPETKQELQNRIDEEFFEKLSKRVLKNIRDSLFSNGESITAEQEKYLEKYANYLISSNIYSEKTARTFEAMIPNSMTSPINEYTRNKKSVFLDHKIVQELIPELINSKEYLDMSNDFISNVYDKNSDEINIQMRYYRFFQDNKRLMNEELVFKQGKEHASFSLLAVTDWESGIKIDLNQFLPEGVKFVSNYFCHKTMEHIYSEEGVDVQKVKLADYEGSRNMSEDNFANYGHMGFVEYGNLLEKGGYLSLFHEIAHSWQRVYYGEDNKKSEFLEIIDYSNEELTNLLEAMILYSENNKLYDDMVAIFKKATVKLKKIGVRFDPTTFVYAGGELEKKDILIKNKEGDSFIIQCDSFNEIIKNFEKEERDAWAHSILILRYLRKKGIDLEPEMKNYSDISSYVHKYLASYQNFASDRVLNKKINFTS